MFSVFAPVKSSGVLGSISVSGRLGCSRSPFLSSSRLYLRSLEGSGVFGSSSLYKTQVFLTLPHSPRKARSRLEFRAPRYATEQTRRPISVPRAAHHGLSANRATSSLRVTSRSTVHTGLGQSQRTPPSCGLKPSLALAFRIMATARLHDAVIARVRSHFAASTALYITCKYSNIK